MPRLPALYTRRWYLYLASCSSWKRYSIVLSFLSVIGVGWLFAVYYPLDEKRRAYEQKLLQLQKQCRACSCAHTTCTQLACSIDTLQNSLKPYQQTDTCPLVLCMELAANAGLTVHACTMGHGTTHDQQKTVSNGSAKELVTLEISGTTQAYMTFLASLAQLSQIITYEQMHIEHAQANQLRATCVIGFVKLG